MTEGKPLLSMAGPLERALEIIRANLERDSAPLQHVLVVAPRGGGKTTFLRALSDTIAADTGLGERAAVALVGALEVGTAGPDHYIDRLAAAFDGGAVQATLDFGQFDEASWTAAVERLDKARTKTAKSRRRLGVLLIDAFDDALRRGFAPKDAQSRLRRLLQSHPGVMLIGAVNSSDVQRDYDERLFQSFLEIDLPQITPADVTRLAGSRRGGRIAAIVTDFIGGSLKRTRILLDVLAREPELAASTLIARLVAHEASGFEALLADLPIRQRRVLDALLVGGEPNRPTGLAELLGTTQADIADAVSQLGATRIIARTDTSTTRRAFYIVADRLLAFWYASHRGSPAYLADLADIVAIGGDPVGAHDGLPATVVQGSRAAAYRALETWLDAQTDVGQAARIAVAALVKAPAAAVVADAADLIAERAGADSAATALLRAAQTQAEAPTRPLHPDIATAMRLIRHTLIQTVPRRRS